ncbi:ECF transporter S component [Streptococcus saliviloxodontae]|uniref:Membrane protein n=1 Tax=Streptococcus saliviloxodontae TaxID=1349416 RepID=A0ABS2PLG9_9STRE|nr:ECF transporter S component [Streptococcus saliviloxodontae]MBM7635926.1 putative membrane protein [Streptococcus saliviloxodontae]
MRRTNVSKLTLLAVLTALTLVLGKFVSIPTPTGFLTLLDAGVFFTAFYLGAKEGAIVGGLSGFLIDLISGYPQWMFFSLLAHGGQGYFAGWTGKSRPIGLALSSLVMVGVYFLASIPLYGLGSAIAGLWGNIMQNFFGLLIGYVVYLAYSKVSPGK